MLRKEISPITAVVIIVVLAAIAAGVYLMVSRPKRVAYDPKKVSEMNRARGQAAFQSMMGGAGAVTPSAGMSGGFRSSGGYGAPTSGGYRGGMSGGYGGGMSGGFQGGMSGGYGGR